MKKIILFYSIYLILNTSFLIHNSLCQYQNILISNEFYPCEVTIIINPKKSNQVVESSKINYLSYYSYGIG